RSEWTRASKTVTGELTLTGGTRAALLVVRQARNGRLRWPATTQSTLDAALARYDRPVEGLMTVAASCQQPLALLLLVQPLGHELLEERLVPFVPASSQHLDARQRVLVEADRHWPCR